jgi:integrase
VASIDRRPNGKWRARWREYPGGPQRARHFVRKIDAERFLVDVQHRLMAGTYIPPEASKVAFGEFAGVYLGRLPWRFATADKALEAVTRARAHWERRPLGSIRKGDVQAFVSGLTLAPSTVRVVHQHLVSLFAAAVDDRLIAANPARGVKLPERSRGEIVPPTPEQVRAIAVELPGWFRISVVLGAGLGLRQAETAGLTVDRIDWLGRAVLIDRQWVTRRGRCEFGPPKTETSHRTIPASPWVLERLGEHVGRRHSGFVLHRDGDPLRHGRFGYYWDRARTRAELPGVRYHDLRHAFASALIAAGCSVKAVQKALGHASAATTLDIYGHLWPGDDDRIRQAVTAAFGLDAEDRLRTRGASS